MKIKPMLFADMMSAFAASPATYAAVRTRFSKSVGEKPIAAETSPLLGHAVTLAKAAKAPVRNLDAPAPECQTPIVQAAYAARRAEAARRSGRRPDPAPAVGDSPLVKAAKQASANGRDGSPLLQAARRAAAGGR